MTTLNNKLLDRFKSKFTLSESGCWEWKAYLMHKGYGHFHINRVPKRAHRVSYEHYKGKIPFGMLVMHTCDNRKCVNPDHLVVGTHQDNMNDMVKKGRSQKVVKGCNKYNTNQSMENNFNSKLTSIQVKNIIKDYKDGAGSYMFLSLKYGVSKSNIQAIINGRSWSNLN